MRASDELHKIWDLLLPVDTCACLSRLGWMVSLDEDETSLAKIKDRSLVLNRKLSSTNKRVVAAFAMALHFSSTLGNQPEIKITNTNFKLLNFDSYEKEKRLALQFLVPREALDALVTRNKITDTKRIAEIFDVSENVVFCVVDLYYA